VPVLPIARTDVIAFVLLHADRVFFYTASKRRGVCSHPDRYTKVTS